MPTPLEMSKLQMNSFTIDLSTIVVNNNDDDFSIQQVAAQGNILEICRHLLPDGEVRNGEYWSRNTRRSDNQIGSFSVNLDTGKAHDFADNTHTSDIVGTVAYLCRTSQSQAAHWIVDNGFLLDKPRQPVITSTAPPPLTVANAAMLWNLANKVTDQAYAQRKRMAPSEFLKQLPVEAIKTMTRWTPKVRNKKDGKDIPLTGMCLLAPIFIDGDLVSLEVIDEHGHKSALPGKNTKKNGYWVPSALPINDGHEPLYISEGVADTMSIHAAQQGGFTVASLSLDNTKNLVALFRKKYPTRPIVVCADHIVGTTEVDPSIVALAQADNVRVVHPIGDYKDFNDVHVLGGGLDAVKQSLNNMITPPKNLLDENDDQWDVNLADLYDAVLEPIQFAIEPMLPKKLVTLLSAHGGAGKSLLALTMASHIACGAPFAGLTTCIGKVLFVSMEDDEQLLRLRLKDIALAYQLDFALLQQNLRIIDASTWEPLAEEVSNAGVKTLEMTPYYERVERMSVGRDVIFIDNASDAFSGNENDRKQVRFFLKALGKTAKTNNAAMVLLAHVDKLAARNGANGNSYSGSTAWHNSVRSRLVLTVNEDGSFMLEQEKLNIKKKMEPLAFEFNSSGVPVLQTHSQKEHRESLTASIDDVAITQAMREAAANSESVPCATQGVLTAWSVLMAYPSMKNTFGNKDGKTRFREALVRLAATKRITKHIEITAGRKQRERWRLADDLGTSGVTLDAESMSPERPWEVKPL